jgi:hypothetical protein
MALTEGRTISFSMRAKQRGGDDLGGRVGAHAAGVRTGVAVADALVVLRGRQDDVIAAGDDDENGGFFADEAVLDQDLAAGGAEFIARKHVVHSGLGFGEGLRDDDPFAGGEPVGLDDDGGAALAEIGERGRDFGEDPGCGGRDLVFQQDVAW